jgi:hypothetical protein
VKGTWQQEFLGGGAAGRFTLTKALPDSGMFTSPSDERCE